MGLHIDDWWFDLGFKVLVVHVKVARPGTHKVTECHLSHDIAFACKCKVHCVFQTFICIIQAMVWATEFINETLHLYLPYTCNKDLYYFICRCGNY